jgi:hypothetical protein
MAMTALAAKEAMPVRGGGFFIQTGSRDIHQA